MTEFPPYNPNDQHSPYNEDLKFEAQDLEKIDKGLKQTSKAIDRAELNLLICDIMISREKPTQEVINKYADRIDKIYEK